MGEPFDVVRATPRIDGAGRTRLLLQQQLGVARYASREVGRQCERLVECVGVQRLGVSLGGGHRLDAGSSDVVKGVLRSQRPTRSLRMRAQ